MENIGVWIGFHIFVLFMLALDLGVFHRKAHSITVKEALLWSGVWFCLALIFNAGIWYWMGKTPALEFFAGYLIEKSLSVDNIFIFLLIFNTFKVSPVYQHRVLFWGIIGALVMRAFFIAAGVVLIAKFHWVVYIFGAFLVFTGIKMLTHSDKEIHPENNIVLRIFKKFFRTTPNFVEGHFFVRQDGRLMATPLFVVLLLIETSDLIFAVDSIPAILAITPDPFIVYTSNIFAILGLRSLYFALGGMMEKFYYLDYGLAAILSFVGIKMLIVDFYKIPIGLSLGIIAMILACAIIASLFKARQLEEEEKKRVESGKIDIRP